MAKTAKFNFTGKRGKPLEQPKTGKPAQARASKQKEQKGTAVATPAASKKGRATAKTSPSAPVAPVAAKTTARIATSRVVQALQGMLERGEEVQLRGRKAKPALPLSSGEMAALRQCLDGLTNSAA